MSRFNFISYSSVIFIFFAGGFFFFYRLFRFLSPIEVIGMIVANKLISFSFFIFLLLLLMSNGITSLSTIYQSDELNFLHSAPVHPTTIFTLKLTETAFYSSWATLVGALPLTTAYLVAFETPLLEIFLFLIPLISFIMIPAGFGVSIIIILKRINPRFTLKQLAVVLGIISGLIIFIYIKTTPYSLDIPQKASLEALNRFMEGLRVSNPYYPNEWFYKSISALTSGKIKDFSRYTGLLLSGGLVSISFSFLLAELFYRKGWMSSSSESVKVAVRKKPLINKMPSLMNLIHKDLKIFFRSPMQWSQLLIIGVLLIIYSISLRRTPLYVEDPFWLSSLALVNTGFIGYIISTLSLRFVYPQISLEGRTWWALRASPIPPKKIIFSKIVIQFLITLIIAELVIIFSNIILVKYTLVVTIFAFITLIFTIVSVYLSVSLGTIFADFEETNPAKIASGAGGLLNASISLLYIAASVAIFFIPISLYIRSQIKGYYVDITNHLIISSVIFILLSLLLIIIPYRIASRKIHDLI